MSIGENCLRISGGATFNSAIFIFNAIFKPRGACSYKRIQFGYRVPSEIVNLPNIGLFGVAAFILIINMTMISATTMVSTTMVSAAIIPAAVISSPIVIALAHMSVASRAMSYRMSAALGAGARQSTMEFEADTALLAMSHVRNAYNFITVTHTAGMARLKFTMSIAFKTSWI